ncbi:hypothetical protein LOCC1_G000804 [Lachnellula occidentalis]|uniref:Mtf2-like C-terminal domain-containing protein n=1 Tax=Lachnellula occidentalis TaxID=215460 RepID=A0A8H8SB85_9HELO|nr:hypothetical protein LOCC1_G000804 [Lachnellula occidentalis]
MTPFLYQTKTLSNFRWVGTNPIFGCRYTRSTVRSWGRDNSDNRSDRVRPAPAKAKGFIKRKPNPPPKSSRNVEFEIPFEFDELHKSGHKKAKGSAIKLNRWDTINVNEFGEADDPVLDGSEFGGEDGDMYPDDDEGPSMNLRGPRESTITEGERRAFQRIFSDMFAQNQLAPKPSQESKDQAKSMLDTILGTAVGKLPKSKEERLKIVNSYPPALRPAAAKAMQLSDAGDDENLFEGEMEELADLDHDQLEALRSPERERVESLMKEARTDFDLWAVLEKEVFSLIHKLGLEEDPLNIGEMDTEGQGKSKYKAGPKASKRKKAKIDSEKEEANKVERFDRVVAQSSNGTDVSALTFYGPLYPSYLLFGIRLLDRSFAKPSPLALSILPKIKSLGAISHVLGASTQLYNEIIRIYYYGYEDFDGVAKTLNEMEHSAVELDEETLDVVIDILRMQATVARGEKGDVMKELWSMPQFARVNFQYWRNKIAKTIHVKTEVQALVSQPMSALR